VGDFPVIERSKRSVPICHTALDKLRRFVRAKGFSSTEEEILFFKELKPSVEGLLFYYDALLRIETARPVGDKKQEEGYLDTRAEKNNTLLL
jgi:hypothetical protein